MQFPMQYSNLTVKVVRGQREGKAAQKYDSFHITEDEDIFV